MCPNNKMNKKCKIFRITNSFLWMGIRLQIVFFLNRLKNVRNVFRSPKN